jgi:hypothetical protein
MYALTMLMLMMLLMLTNNQSPILPLTTNYIHITELQLHVCADDADADDALDADEQPVTYSSFDD